MSETITADPPPAPAPQPAAEPAPAAPADETAAHGTLELRLDPDDADRLPRVPDLARLRAGRGRTVAVRLVWHDTPDGALAEDGLTLCERHLGRETVWRLERLRGTIDAPWPPGTPAPVRAEAATPEALDHRLPAPLVPVAACDGQLRALPLSAAAGGVEVTLLLGTLRAVAGERPVARLTLNGPPAAIEALALALTQHVRLAVPEAALAAEACMTAGRNIPPRAIGAPILPTDAPVSCAFAALLGHLAGVILHWAPAAREQAGPEPVHQMRVALRRLRSAMSLFRRAVGDSTLDAVRQDLKSLQQVLGPPRDWDVFTAGTGRAVAAALPDDRPLARLLAAAGRRRQDGYIALNGFLTDVRFRRLGIRLACLAAFRPWEQGLAEPGDDAAARQAAAQAASLRDFAARALARRLARVLAQGDDLSGLSSEELHALRIQGKRLRYAAEFFAPLYPGRETRRFLRRVATLQERLGHMNDTVVAATLMAELAGGGERGYAVGVVRGFVAAGQRGARAKLERSWRKFRRVEPFWT